MATDNIAKTAAPRNLLDIPLRKARGSDEVRVTPEIAAHWLTYNTGNRAVVRANFERIKADHEGDPDEHCKGDPVAFVSSENTNRRHLSESQLAHAIAAMKPYEERKARERMAAGGAGGVSKGMADRPYLQDAGTTASVLAVKAGIGARTVTRAIAVREKGTPELNHAVASGEMAVNFAEQVARLNPSAQNKIVNTPKEHRKDELRTAMNRSEGSRRRELGTGGKRKGLPPEPATSFVRKLLSGIERTAMVCAEDGAKTDEAIASKFLDEMDWNAQGLLMQLERCKPVISAWSIILQQRKARAA